MMRGKEVILTDDSIVRGTTMKIIVDQLRKKAEPTKVHIMVGFPPKRFACPYGAESSKSLIANELGTVDEIAERIGADTLVYGTHEMWENVLGTDCCYRCEQGYPKKK